MANYYTEASFILPLTEEQTEFALSVIECFEDERIDLTKNHKTKAGREYNNDVYRVAKKLAKRSDSYEWNSVQFHCEATAGGIWISHDESICTDTAALYCHIILKYFNSNDSVSIEAAHTCSKPRLDGFGGHAAFVTKKGVTWTSTHQWLYKQKQRHEMRYVH